jgi:hypothetical protein
MGVPVTRATILSVKHAMTRKPKPMLYGRELSADELETIRRHVESFDVIDGVTDEMRELIAREWPELLSKLRPPR